MRTFALIAVLALAACNGQAPEPTDSDTPAPAVTASETLPGPVTPAPESSQPADSECGADKLGRWLNLLPTEPVKADIEDAVGHDRIRYIAPGDVVTMDMRPDRLNVETGVDGRIKRFRCG